METNETRRILDLLAAGRINADQAERLLAAVRGGHGAADGSPVSGTPAEAKAKPRYLRVLIEGDEKENHGRINVRVPLALVRAGVKLSRILPESAQRRINEALAEKDLDFDLNSVKPQDIDALVDHLGELTVDIDGRDGDDKGTVRIFCE